MDANAIPYHERAHDNHDYTPPPPYRALDPSTRRTDTAPPAAELSRRPPTDPALAGRWASGIDEGYWHAAWPTEEEERIAAYYQAQERLEQSTRGPHPRGPHAISVQRTIPVTHCSPATFPGWLAGWLAPVHSLGADIHKHPAPKPTTTRFSELANVSLHFPAISKVSNGVQAGERLVFAAMKGSHDHEAGASIWQVLASTQARSRRQKDEVETEPLLGSCGDDMVDSHDHEPNVKQERPQEGVSPSTGEVIIATKDCTDTLLASKIEPAEIKRETLLPKLSDIPQALCQVDGRLRAAESQPSDTQLVATSEAGSTEHGSPLEEFTESPLPIHVREEGAALPSGITRTRPKLHDEQ